MLSRDLRGEIFPEQASKFDIALDGFADVGPCDVLVQAYRAILKLRREPGILGSRVGEGRHAFRAISTAFVPPKEKEFDMTVSSFSPVLALPGT